MVVLSGPIVIALWFLNSYAFKYLAMDPDRLGIYWPRREWLFAHIIGGSVALLLGPIQLWFGLTRQSMRIHRILGIGYVIGVATSGIAAFYLAFHTDFGWVVGLGMFCMGLAWTVSTALATISIYRGFVQQHKEWMIRSYVLTFSFITFRLVTTLLELGNVGTTVEQMTAASWFSWAFPLLVLETVLQGRKILAPKKATEPVISASAETLTINSISAGT